MRTTLRGLVVVAFAAQALIGAAAPGGAVVGQPYIDDAYAFSKAASGANAFWPTGRQTAQPFTAAASGLVGEVSLPLVESSPDAALTVAITDASSWPDPGVVLASESIGVNGEAAPVADLTADAVTLTRGVQYVLTVTVDAGTVTKYVAAVEGTSTAEYRYFDSNMATWNGTNGYALTGSIDVSGYDANAPTVSVTFTPADPDGLNGWYASTPDVTVECADATTRVVDCPDALSWPDGPHAGYLYAHDLAGNQGSSEYFDLQIDSQPPTVSIRPDRKANEYGWYRAKVWVAVGCLDGVAPYASGVDSCTGSQWVERTTDVQASGSDFAGHVVTKSRTVKVDTREPSVKIPGLEPGEVFASKPDLGCKAADGTGRSASGVLSCRTTIEHLRHAKYAATAVAKDKAGNRAELRVVFSVR